MTDDNASLIPLFIAAVMALIAGYSAAKRKGRARILWAIACGVMPVLLFVLEFLPSELRYNDLSRKAWPGVFERWGMVVIAVTTFFLFNGDLGIPNFSNFHIGDHSSRTSTSKNNDDYELFTTKGDVEVTPEASMTMAELTAMSGSGGKIKSVSNELILFMHDFHQDDVDALGTCAHKIGGMERHAFSLNTFRDVSKACYDEVFTYMRNCRYRFDYNECRLAAQKMEIIFSSGKM